MTGDNGDKTKRGKAAESESIEEQPTTGPSEEQEAAGPSEEQTGQTEQAQPESPWAGGAGEAERPPPEGEASQPEETGAEGETVDAAALVAELEAKLAEAKDQVLRAYAEAENVRKRGARQIEEAQKYGVSGLAKDLLNVADNLRRALDAIPEDAHVENELLGTLFAGVEGVEKDLLTAFKKHGIEKIEPIGELFDPNYHQAMFEVESADHPPGTVVQLLQPGYVLNGRLLRAAMVGVAKNGSEERKVDTTA
ncbi:MAG: nucleotide exchange factor GrpE [Alphaproteobacteria bacterium]